MMMINLKKKGLMRTRVSIDKCGSTDLPLQPVAPDHNFFFGHLLYLKSVIDSLPPKTHYHYAFEDIARKHFTNEETFYVDV
jgi:hypothetical protein